MSDSFIIIGNGGHAKSVADAVQYAMGIGGVEPNWLKKRLTLMRDEKKSGKYFPRVVHPTAYVSPEAIIWEGAQVMAMAFVGPGAEIKEGAIVNTRAIVEHDAKIGAGAHIAPGAIVLGGAIVEECTMVGAGAVVIQGTRASGMVKALTVSKGKK